MDNLNKIDDLLNQEGFETRLTETGIEWKDAFGAECSISKFEVVQNNEGAIAWVQDNEVGKCFLRILYKNYTTFSWKLYSGHPDWGFGYNFIRWFGNKLIVIYSEKHSHYLVKIENFNVDILFIGSITHISLTYEKIINENIFYIKQRENKGILHRIALSDYQTSVNSVPEENIVRNTDIVLKKIDEFHLD